MKRNDTVTIYEDPITKTKPEGKAKLRREVRPDDGDGLAIWEVEFIDDEYITTRTISTR